MAIQNDRGELISFECSDIIDDVKEDLQEYRRQTKVYAACRFEKGVKIIFDYFFNDIQEMAMFPPLKEDEWFEKMTLAELLAYLTRLNNITNRYKSITELFNATGWTFKKFSEYFKIPQRTVEDWVYGKASCADYIVRLMNYKLLKENII